jgi:uncharacterized RDD family membrane protein YckC
MEKQVNKEESSTPILFETDEFDVDSFNVKPLSKGLGFHQEREKIRPNRAHKQGNKVHKPLATRSEQRTSQQVIASPKVSNTSEMFWDQTVSQTELSHFYKQSSSDNQQEFISNEQVMVPLKATFSSRILAWIVDVFALGVICAALLFSFVALAGMNMGTLLKGMYLGPLELSVFGLGLFSLLYIFYFTILDMAASPGKSLLGLRVCATNGERPKATQTLVRSVVSLLSLFLLGLPAILDFQSHLSESFVAQDSDHA